MANLTITVNGNVLQRARIRALEQGTSVNAVLGNYLAAFAGEDESSVALAEFLDLAAAAQIAPGPRRWKRDDVYDRISLRRG